MNATNISSGGGGGDGGDGVVVVTDLRKTDGLTWDDATWILTSSFIIFTMQSGFGLLESGIADMKNEVNIMVKNAVDVVFGGISYWMVGYGLSHGDAPGSNPVVGFGRFFVDAEPDEMGWLYSDFIFHLSFATTATTIVSGAMAERTKLSAYIVFSFINTIIYSFPAHWVWADNGFLRQMGVVDIAGASTVHLVGGTTGLVATLMLKPRLGRFGAGSSEPSMGCPTNAILGMFMLWWGWLGFNCGSTFGISGHKWKYATRSACTTIMSSVSGGVTGVTLSYIFQKRHIKINYLINGVLGALVSITGACAIAAPWEGIVIGFVGAVLALAAAALCRKLHIDDPVDVVPVHGVCSIWGMLAIGIFVAEDKVQSLTFGRSGFLRGGGGMLLAVQALACVVIFVWSALVAFILLKLIDMTIGLRLSAEDEIKGSDLVEHGIDLSLESPISEFTQQSTSVSPLRLNAPRYSRRTSFGFRRNSQFRSAPSSRPASSRAADDVTTPYGSVANPRGSLVTLYGSGPDDSVAGPYSTIAGPYGSVASLLSAGSHRATVSTELMAVKKPKIRSVSGSLPHSIQTPTNRLY